MSALRLPTRVATRLAVCLTLAATLSPSASDAYSGQNFLRISHSAAAPSGARTLCQTYAWACSVNRAYGKISSKNLDTVLKVNRSVNRRVREVTDLVQFRVQEHWTLPTSRGGDCEDFALLKKQELIRLGFPPQALLIATVLDRSRQGHAVLIVRTDAGDLVLDNLTNEVKPWSKTGYIFLRMQNPKAPNRWVSVAPAV